MAILLNSIIVTVCFIAVWAWQLKSKNAGVVDAVWGVIFPIQAVVYYISIANFSIKNLIVLSIISFWGLRLGIYLAVRNIGKPEDKRYAQIRIESGGKANQKILVFYLVQVFLAIILFIPVYFIFQNLRSEFSIFDYLGIALFAIAAIGEASADEQLRVFKSKPENNGQIMNQGLWYYSRHPNYFFEWIAWVSISILSLNVAWGSLAIICPVTMYVLLTKGTGIRMTEATILTTKSEKYKIYMASTSPFFPWMKTR